MKKLFRRTGITLLALILVIIATVFVLFFHEIKTLLSLKKVDDYPFYEMTYSGDYGFDEFLKVGAKSDKDIEKFVVKRLLKGMDIDLGITGAGCTAFTTHNKSGEPIMGRNFDFPYSPSMLLRTKPKNGYESVSIVNLTYAGYGKDNLPDPYTMNSFLTLAAPYLPFDGMNECGVTMSLLAVPFAEPPNDEGKVTLNTTTAIRLVLDKAKDVGEAMELLCDYNYYFSGGIDCHYLLGDVSGSSVVVEFIDGEIKFIEKELDYQVLSNFIIFDDMDKGDGFTRSAIAKKHLFEKGGKMTDMEAIDILQKVSIKNRTQWSVVYNMENLEFVICIDEKYDSPYKYQFR